MIVLSFAVAELKGEINLEAHTLLAEFSRAFSASFSGSSGTSSLSKVTLIFCGCVGLSSHFSVGNSFGKLQSSDEIFAVASLQLVFFLASWLFLSSTAGRCNHCWPPPALYPAVLWGFPFPHGSCVCLPGVPKCPAHPGTEVFAR